MRALCVVLCVCFLAALVAASDKGKEPEQKKKKPVVPPLEFSTLKKNHAPLLRTRIAPVCEKYHTEGECNSKPAQKERCIFNARGVCEQSIFTRIHKDWSLRHELKVKVARRYITAGILDTTKHNEDAWTVLLQSALDAAVADFKQKVGGKPSMVLPYVTMQRAFGGSVLRLLERFTLDRDELRAKFHLAGAAATDVKIHDLRFFDSDAHGDFDRVVRITCKGNTANHHDEMVHIIYKPSSVHGHYFLQGDEHSLIQELNAHLGGGPHGIQLPVFTVVSRYIADPNSVGHGLYGYVEFIKRDDGYESVGERKKVHRNGGNIDFTQEADFERFAKQAGVFSFACWLFGLTDLHYENIMSTTNGLYAIDAEMALSPKSAFTLSSTGLFGPTLGAFDTFTDQTFEGGVSAGHTINSPVKFQGTWRSPITSPKFIEGYRSARAAVADHLVHYQAWFTGLPAHQVDQYPLHRGPISRINPLSTTDFRQLTLKGQFQGVEGSGVPADVDWCGQSIAHYTGLANSKPETANYYFAKVSVFEDGCKNLKAPAWSPASCSFPIYFQFGTDKRLYYHDLEHVTHLPDGREFKYAVTGLAAAAQRLQFVASHATSDYAYLVERAQWVREGEANHVRWVQMQAQAQGGRI